MKRTQYFAISLFALATGFLQAATLDVDHGKSRIQVDAKATGHAFTGTLDDYSANVKGDATSGAPAAFDLNWSFKDLKTDDDKRDKEMIKWLGGGNPKGSFKFEKTWTGKDGKPYAQGELKINGMSKTVSFPYTTKRDGEWMTIDGRVAMNYKDFGLPLIRAMALMTVDPQLTVRFHVVGKVK